MKRGFVLVASRFNAKYVQGLVTHCTDERITRYCENYEFRRISAVDRNVLRLGIFEMFYRDDISPVVSINEAIELAKEFGGPDSGRFVSGILDRVKNDLPGPFARRCLQPPVIRSRVRTESAGWRQPSPATLRQGMITLGGKERVKRS